MVSEANSSVIPTKRHHEVPAVRWNSAMTRLGELLALYRVVHHVALRDLADEIGIHKNTLNRFERTDAEMSTGNFLKILAWLLGPATSAAVTPREEPR